MDYEPTNSSNFTIPLPSPTVNPFPPQYPSHHILSFPSPPLPPPQTKPLPRLTSVLLFNPVLPNGEFPTLESLPNLAQVT